MNVYLPDKAIDVIDEAGARSRLAQQSRHVRTVSVADIESMVAKMARIPEKSSIVFRLKSPLQKLDDRMKMLVFWDRRLLRRCDRRGESGWLVQD